MINSLEAELKPFHLAASYTIGSHILPGKPLEMMQQTLVDELKLSILSCHEIIVGVKEERFDLGLIESPIFDSSLIYKEWIKDELVVCSKQALPSSLTKEKLKQCKLVCRKEGSITRNFIENFLTMYNLSYQNFKSLSEINNTTAIIQSVKWAKPNIENPTIAIVSQLAIQDELKYDNLYQSRIENHPMIRKFHLIYSKKNENNPMIKEMIQQLIESVSLQKEKICISNTTYTL